MVDTLRSRTRGERIADEIGRALIGPAWHGPSLNELLSLLGGDTAEGLSRQDAIACYLSGSDGWRDAVKMLGGAFAAEATGLKGRKDD